MAIDPSLFEKPLVVDSIAISLDNGTRKEIDLLRLDQIHPTLSGNKWFKLKYNLLEAENKGSHSILSFGGAYSNHLHALAFAGKQFGLKTIGIVRGEKVANPCLKDCQDWGMELHFVSRAEYKIKDSADYTNTLKQKFPNSYLVPEGGDNEQGQKGCAEILNTIDTSQYDILCCAIGTGTTIRGLAETFNKEIWGFAPFRNAHSLKEKLVRSISRLRYIDQYHFGGFGKVKPALLQFQQNFQSLHKIELDRVYTSKMLFGIKDILNTEPIQQSKKILIVHTGGLQGNRSGN